MGTMEYNTDSQIAEVTKLVRPQIEARERRPFGLFRAMSYYTWLGFWKGDFLRRLFWIKVKYDDGIMHVKVEELLIHVGDFTLMDEAVLEYQTGKTEEDLLSYFWFNFEELSRSESSSMVMTVPGCPVMPMAVPSRPSLASDSQGKISEKNHSS